MQGVHAAAAEGAYRVLRLPQTLTVAPDQNQGGAEAAELLGGGQPQPAGGTGDHDDAAVDEITEPAVRHGLVAKP